MAIFYIRKYTGEADDEYVSSYVSGIVSAAFSLGWAHNLIWCNNCRNELWFLWRQLSGFLLGGVINTFLSFSITSLLLGEMTMAVVRKHSIMLLDIICMTPCRVLGVQCHPYTIAITTWDRVQYLWLRIRILARLHACSSLTIVAIATPQGRFQLGCMQQPHYSSYS